jgi:PPOX class probable F420-dependent enzyme
MTDISMTPDEREAFLADVHVGVLSVARDHRGPLAIPVWYDVEDGDIIVTTDGRSLKARLLRAAGRATLVAQTEEAPYKYVTVEGPVTVQPDQRDVYPMAARYLGPDLGRWYADNNPRTDDTVIIRLTPESWITSDYGKALPS